MRIPIPKLPGYFVDKKGMICYRLNGNGKWMYCKKIENKQGWVWVYYNGARVPHHQKQTADILLKEHTQIERPFRTKPIVEPPDEAPKPSALQPSKLWD
jgi:hypothetical protein